MLGRWADVMLNADAYAEIVDRHVELAAGIGLLEGALDNFEPPDDARRWQRSRANPGIQLTSNDEDVIVERLVAVTQLAERLDRRTLDLAARLVPHQWWTERLSPRTHERAAGKRADSSSGLHCRGESPRRADASGDAPLTGLPWRPKQLERMRLRYPCRATCQCATATPDARWIRSSR